MLKNTGNYKLIQVQFHRKKYEKILLDQPEIRHYRLRFHETYNKDIQIEVSFKVFCLGY